MGIFEALMVAVFICVILVAIASRINELDDRITKIEHKLQNKE